MLLFTKKMRLERSFDEAGKLNTTGRNQKCLQNYYRKPKKERNSSGTLTEIGFMKLGKPSGTSEGLFSIR
jgi:hypothetical protein